MDRETQKTVNQLRHNAAREASRKGLTSEVIAEKIGTSSANVRTIITRGAPRSLYTAKIDELLREAVPEYGNRVDEIVGIDTAYDAFQKCGNLLATYGKVLLRPTYSPQEKLDILKQVRSNLNMFIPRLEDALKRSKE